MASKKKPLRKRERPVDPMVRRFIREAGQAVATMRDFNELTQEQVGLLIGASPASMSRMERGIEQRPRPWLTLYQIGRALGWQMKVVFAEPERGAKLIEVQKPRPGRKKVKPPPPRIRPQKPFSLADLEPWGMD